MYLRLNPSRDMHISHAVTVLNRCAVGGPCPNVLPGLVWFRPPGRDSASISCSLYSILTYCCSAAFPICCQVTAGGAAFSAHA